MIPLENTHNHRPQIGPYGCPKSSQWLLHHLFLNTILSSPTSFSPDNLLTSCLVFLTKPQAMRSCTYPTITSTYHLTQYSDFLPGTTFLIKFPCFRWPVNSFVSSLDPNSYWVFKDIVPAIIPLCWNPQFFFLSSKLSSFV